MSDYYSANAKELASCQSVLCQGFLEVAGHIVFSGPVPELKDIGDSHQVELMKSRSCSEGD